MIANQSTVAVYRDREDGLNRLIEGSVCILPLDRSSQQGCQRARADGSIDGETSLAAGIFLCRRRFSCRSSGNQFNLDLEVGKGVWKIGDDFHISRGVGEPMNINSASQHMLTKLHSLRELVRIKVFLSSIPRFSNQILSVGQEHGLVEYRLHLLLDTFRHEGER